MDNFADFLRLSGLDIAACPALFLGGPLFNIDGLFVNIL
jgi:hypothetical protein